MLSDASGRSYSECLPPPNHSPTPPGTSQSEMLGADGLGICVEVLNMYF